MSELEDSGYKGQALQLLQQADCSVGDIIKITSKGKTYEGILIPRFGEGTAIISQDEKRLQHRHRSHRRRESGENRQRHQTHIRGSAAAKTEPRPATCSYHEHRRHNRQPS